MNEKKQKPLALAPASEETRIVRTVLGWLNGCAELPFPVLYEQLAEGEPGLSMHIEQNAYKLKQYILGGYQAQLRFSVWYRVQPGKSSDERLRADELLNAVGEWACGTALPDLGGGCRAQRMETEKRAEVCGAWENGDEDHRILLRLTYEKI